MRKRVEAEALALLNAATATGDVGAVYACAQKEVWTELCEQLTNP